MGAKIRIEGDSTSTTIDGLVLANMPHMLDLVTDLGELDLTFTPAGPRNGFEGWSRDASQMEISDGLVVRVASLDDIIESKRAANRAKDHLALPYLESLRDQLREADDQVD